MRSISNFLLMLLTVTAVLSGSTVWGMGPQYGANYNRKPPEDMEETIRVFDDQLHRMIKAQDTDYKIFVDLMDKAEKFRKDWKNSWDKLGCHLTGNCLVEMQYDVNKDPDHYMNSYAQFCDQWAKSMHTLSSYSEDQAGSDLCPPIAKVVGKKCYPFKDYITHTSYGENGKLLKVLRCQKKK